jgi:hypothetical protein
VGGFIDKKQRLPSPLIAQGIAYDATSRRIELERAQVRLRRRQTHGSRHPRCGKKFPLFMKPMKSALTLLFQNKPSAPGIAYDAMSRLIVFEQAQG